MSCIERNSNRVIVLKENNRSVRFDNPTRAEFEVGHVDGCLVTSEVAKCDKFLRNDDLIYLIELKGRDVQHAVDQIVNTSKIIRKEIQERKVVPVIVASKCPAIPLQTKVLRKLKDIVGNYSSEDLVLSTRVAKINL